MQEEESEDEPYKLKAETPLRSHSTYIINASTEQMSSVHREGLMNRPVWVPQDNLQKWTSPEWPEVTRAHTCMNTR